MIASLEFYLYAKMWLATEMPAHAKCLVNEALATVNAINAANLGRAKGKLSGLTKVPDEMKFVIAA